MPEDRFARSKFADQIERLRRRYTRLKFSQYGDIRIGIEGAKIQAGAYILPEYPLLLPKTDVQACEEACELIQLCARRMRLRIRSASLCLSHFNFSNDSCDRRTSDGDHAGRCCTGSPKIRYGTSLLKQPCSKSCSSVR